jgi:hypothetical protein
MKARIWIGVILFVVLIIATLVIWVSSQDKSRPAIEGEIQFSTGCNDIVDISILPQDKKIEVCSELISSKTADLEKIGVEPKDCHVIRTEVMDCEPALGTELVCTYLCNDNAE